MTVVTCTTTAKCKYCKWITAVYLGKHKKHRCLNIMSPCYNAQVIKNDLACIEWEIRK
jgi:hypothetical protein